MSRFTISALVVAVLTSTMSAAEPDVLEKAPSTFAKHDKNRIHYKNLGEGKTAVVFVHGWCCDLTVWDKQAAALDGKTRMLFIDLPGYGKSDKPKIDYTMDVFAKGVNAVMEDAGVEKAVLVGHSMGTPVVRQFYRLYPDKTKALVFVDGALKPFSDDPAVIEKFMSMFKEETFKETAPKFIASMLPADTPPEVRKRIEKLVSDVDPRVAVNSMHKMMDAKLWKDDPVKVPAQALMAKSPFWTEDYKKFVKKVVPELDYREFDGVGHFLFMEKPKEVNAALLEFLKKQEVVK
ncbi:MAG: alpha/beta hydrolase [Planctomycetia bacterium]|nr:alpha/beta hydrolase [Planctomycetia bacterium]